MQTSAVETTISTPYPIFSSPLQEDLQHLTNEMKLIDKAELHLHLGGAWPLDFLREIATPSDFLELSHKLDQIQKGVDYHEVFSVFNMIGKIVNTDEKVEGGVAALCAALIQDGVTYAEFRTGLKDLGTGLEGYLKAVFRGMEKGILNSPLKAGVILSLRRDASSLIVRETVDLAQKYFQKGVVGIDISGDSTLGSGDEIFPALAQVKELGIPISLHLGESPQELPEQQIKELQEIEPKRIGHGVHLCEKAKHWIQRNEIPIELCLTSAVKAGMISQPADHPAFEWLRQNHPVFICTDDPLVFGTSLSAECAKVAYLIKPLADKEKMENLQFLTRLYGFIQDA